MITGSAVRQIRPKSEPNTATVIEPQKEEGRKAVGDVLREGSKPAHGVELVRRSASRTVLAPTTQPRARSSLNGVGALAPSPGRPSCPGSDQDAHRALMERYFGSNLTRHACQSGRIKSREASADMCGTGAPGPLSGSPSKPLVSGYARGRERGNEVRTGCHGASCRTGSCSWKGAHRPWFQGFAFRSHIPQGISSAVVELSSHEPTGAI